MYKYLYLSENSRELMVGFGSIPVPALVIDDEFSLVEINRKAMDLFMLESFDQLIDQRQRIFSNFLLDGIIYNLKKGLEYESEVMRLYVNQRHISVFFSATMIVNQKKKLFLFVFNNQI